METACRLPLQQSQRLHALVPVNSTYEGPSTRKRPEINANLAPQSFQGGFPARKTIGSFLPYPVTCFNISTAAAVSCRAAVGVNGGRSMIVGTTIAEYSFRR